MIYVIGLFTAVIVLDSVFLILLVLMQLPKKDAGAGLAFGGGATDALFGAGSGNFLTKATKYAAVLFFVLAMVLSVMQSHFAHRPNSQFRKELEKAAQAAATAPAIVPTSKGPAATQAESPGPAANPAPSSGGGLLPLTSPGGSNPPPAQVPKQ